MTTPAGRILGIDYGSKRVGLALSDPMRIIAQGAGVWEANGSLIRRLVQLIGERAVSLVVVGMPLDAKDEKGPKAREVEQFVGRLRDGTNVAVDTWDESFTSVRAKEVFLQTGMRKKQRRQKERVDEMAARLLLQDYLDAHRT